MAIRQTKYIDITSGVGGQSTVSDREMIARIFTDSPLCGIGHVYEFADADAVMSYFGSESVEYSYAARYFGFISKSVSKAKKISYIKWAPTGSLPYIKSTAPVSSIIEYYKNSNGKLMFSFGETTEEFTVNVSSAESLTDVATAIQTAIDAKYSGTTVDITSGIITITLPNSITDTVNACVAYTVSSGTHDLATLLNITSGGAPVLSNYSNAETPAEAASRSDSISDNYGSFFFVGNTTPTKEQSRAVAQWNKTKNYKYLYIVARVGYTTAIGSLAGDIVDWADKDDGLFGFTGTALWCYRKTSDRIEALPSALFATTDYSRANTTKTFMYQMDDTISAAITNDATANILDALNVNYIGVTQSAGGLIQFSQDGNNMDGVETSVYCNEVWMKASFWTNIMNLFLAVEKVPANDDGIALIKSMMMSTITTAISNGTIQAHKELTTVQKAYIGQVLADTEAWKNVYQNGYVLQISIANENNRYIGKYLLVYSKGDAVRKVEGSDILI